ncbi:MAG: DEAD/DEAH box helicase family protein [Candidatus Omnitrophica bacterium]|nr:DEAD/DEAH box helicase family protein [Candidatus Omnitrophota bacterium]
MTKSEAQTRQFIINQRLKLSGWEVKNPLHVTEELDIWVGLPAGVAEPQTPYQGHIFADYVLLGKDGKPLAVVEAKKTTVDAEIGKEQARNYAQKIHETTGAPMPFVFYTNGYDLYFWDTERFPPRKILGYPSRSDLERMQFLRDNSKPLSSQLVDTRISGRPYQIEGIRAVLEAIEKRRRKFLMVMATGTGKTRTCMGIVDVLARTNHAQRVLFLVDRIALQEQALDAFKEHLPNAPIWPKEGEREFVLDRRVYVMTYPTMLNLIQQEDCPFTPHFFDLLIADESHRSIYNVYKNILDYFDALQLGLTATPKDHIDHNTFGLFECDEGLPTYAYTYEEAVNNVPPYLSDFEVFGIQTKFQQEGINSTTIAEADKKRLLADGQDPDEINFEGTELEKKVSNRGTNAVIVREFMEECIKDPNGVLPGKSIVFAISKKHAYRLCEVFNALYPEYKGQLAEVIISDVKGVHGKGGILDRFKNQDMPRIAISVDMLDTGIDVREVVNLVFAKPVLSYTKFWQMIGRGTRILDPEAIKPWCPQKEKFLIMDCWKNFEYFKMKPKGKEPGGSLPLPVRLFEARLKKLEAAVSTKNAGITEKTQKQIMNDIRQLPSNNVIVLDGKKYLDEVLEPGFWLHMNDDKFKYLRLYVTPIMRAKSEADFKAMHFELDIVDLSTAHILKDHEKFENLKEGVIETVSELPLEVNIVAEQEELIRKVTGENFWMVFTDDDLDEVIESLGPLMKFRGPKRTREVLPTDLQDLLVQKDYIEFGPKHERLTTNQYRLKVEEFIRDLVRTNPALQKLSQGQDLSEDEIVELAKILEERYPNVTEYILREIYDNRSAHFVQFIKHILGIETLATFTESVSLAFDEFIRKHNNYGQIQIQFLLTLKSFILQKGAVEKRDLVNAPFTQIHPQGIRGIFKPNEIEEIVDLTLKVADKGE